MVDPVDGAAAPDVNADGDGEDTSEGLTPPENNGEWWKFSDKTTAEDYFNKQITKRLARVEKTKINPLVGERDTLRAEVDRLKPFEDATKSADERKDARIAELEQSLAPLAEYKKSNEHSNLVRQIAEEVGLPASFVSRVRGDDEDSIREDAQSLLDALSESGSNSKQAPKPKSPQEKKQKDPENLRPGGGGETEEDDVSAILEKLAKNRGNPFQLRG